MRDLLFSVTAGLVRRAGFGSVLAETLLRPLHFRQCPQVFRVPVGAQCLQPFTQPEIVS